MSLKIQKIQDVCESLRNTHSDSIVFNSYWDSEPDAIGISDPDEPKRLPIFVGMKQVTMLSWRFPQNQVQIDPTNWQALTMTVT